jgi:hypothetical protein
MRLGRTVFAERDPEDTDGTRDVLDALLAAIDKLDVELAMYLLANASGHANATRFGQCFQARRDVDSVAGNIVAVDNDVTEVDTDAELDALVGFFDSLSRTHRALHVDRAAEGGVRAAEFEQHPVTGGLDDPAAMFGNFRIDDALANLPQPRERSASSRSMCRLKPTTSAMSMAASLRVTALRFTVASVETARSNRNTVPG